MIWKKKNLLKKVSKKEKKNDRPTFKEVEQRYKEVGLEKLSAQEIKVLLRETKAKSAKPPKLSGRKSELITAARQAGYN